MGEHLADTMLQLAAVVRWLEKYETANALIYFSRWLRLHDIRDLEALQERVEYEEREEPPHA